MHHATWKAGTVKLDLDEIEKANIIRAAMDLHKFPHEVMRDLYQYPESMCKPSTWLMIAYQDVKRADAEIQEFREIKAKQAANRKKALGRRRR